MRSLMVSTSSLRYLASGLRRAIKTVRGWHAAKLVLTELEGRFGEACSCCARWNEVASDPFPPLAKGGPGGVMREPWKSNTTLPASREECRRTKVRGHEREFLNRESETDKRRHLRGSMPEA